MSDQSVRRRTAIFLSVMTVVWVLVGLLAIFPSLISSMMFDAGETTGMVINFFTILLFPWACLLTPVVAWVLFAMRRYRDACWVNIWPVLHFLAILGQMAVISMTGDVPKNS